MRVTGRQYRGMEKEKIYLCQGVSLVAPVSMPKLNKSLEVFTKGVIEVLIVFGVIGGFMSSINMTYQMPLILLSYILMAAYFSNLFRTQKIWKRDIGYLVYLGVFFAFVVVARRYVNSGFYALMNELLNRISLYYNVSDIRVFQEYISERTLTVPLAVIFIGNIAIVILNIFLSYFMSETMAVLFGLPVFLIPLFFRLEPDTPYVICVIAGIIGVFALKGNRHYRISKNQEQFQVKSRGKKKEITYGRSGKAAAEMTLSVFVVSMLIVLLVGLVRPKNEFEYRFKTSSLKSQIEIPLGNALLYGLSSLRNMPNTGGMAGGRLGGVSSVLNDNKTDLIVTYEPKAAERMYLKAFVGDIYASDHWEKDADGLLPNTDDTSGKKEKVEVENVDADIQYLYLPPNMKLGEAEIKRYQGGKGLLRYGKADYEYVPDGWSQEKPEKETYLQIPDENKEVLAEFCQDAELYGTDAEIVDRLEKYFEEEFTYTLHPGATPVGADYVNHFLQRTKKGLCAHFASSTVLILRQMGIPARYVEGYVVDYVNVLESLAKSGENENQPEDPDRVPDELLSRISAQQDELADNPDMVTVEVPDGNAHAWVEAYLDGKWQIVDITPPSFEDEDVDANDFWAMAGISLFDMGSPDGGDATEILGDKGLSIAFDAGKGILGLFAGVIGIALALFLGRFVYHKGKLAASWHGKNKKENTIAYYAYLCNYMRFVSPDFPAADSHYKQLKLMAPQMEDKKLQSYAKLLERISYSMLDTGENLAKLDRWLKAVLKQNKKSQKWKTRFMIFWKL